MKVEQYSAEAESALCPTLTSHSQECMIKMGVENEANETVQLLAEKVCSQFQNLCHGSVERKKTNVPIIKFQKYQGTIFSPN